MRENGAIIFINALGIMAGKLLSRVSGQFGLSGLILKSVQVTL